MAIRYLLALLLLVAACRPSGEAETAADQGRQSMELFLLAGQSNMAGRGDVEASDRMADARVKMLTREMEWAPAADPIHFDKPIAGVGPGRAFGLAVAEKHPGATIGLVPAAVGGSSILAWRPGARDEATGTHPYDDAMIRMARARKQGEIKAVLWHQGESDAQPALAPLYKERLAELISRFREQSGNPNLPFLIGQLGRFPEKPWSDTWVAIDRAHRELAAEVPNVAFVSSEGLTHKGDTLHFDTASAHELGRRYAEAYFRLIETP